MALTAAQENALHHLEEYGDITVKVLPSGRTQCGPSSAITLEVLRRKGLVEVTPESKAGRSGFFRYAITKAGRKELRG